VENQIGRARATSVDVQSLLRAATSAVSADLPESPAVDSKSDEVFEKDDGQKEDEKNLGEWERLRRLLESDDEKVVIFFSSPCIY
jgi:hypothetical protein